jgi:GT2 family glycosyltransferase
MPVGTNLPETTPKPDVKVSVIILNYNGLAWVPNCLESLRKQTIFDQLQVIFADNVSTDGSDRLAEKQLAGWTNGLFVQNGVNPGFGGGCNLVINRATGKYLFFLNPDVRLEPDCLEQLYLGAEKAQAGAAGLVVLEYEDDTYWSRGGAAFDFCANVVIPRPGEVPDVLFVCHGFYFIRKDVFERVGRYDDTFFLYGEELDLSWRVWAAGERIIHVPTAKIHHRGEALENPEGGTKMVVMRTSESKRFYANRNQLVTILKLGQHVLLLMFFTATAMITLEAIAGAILLRRWSFFSRTCLQALTGCWKLRRHIWAERKRIRSFRKRGDFWILRFFSWRPGRWEDYRAILKQGLPRVDRR